MRIDIFATRTDALRFDDAIEQLHQWAIKGHQHYVCTCPVYTLMRAAEDPTVQDALNAADMVTADGMPVVWLQRRLGVATAERVYGPDILRAICALKGLSHCFWGGQVGIAQRMADALRASYPHLTIAGAISPPIRPLEDQPDPHIIAQLNALNADIIWVGLGSPKQDLWMQRYRPHLNAPLLIGVGAAFDFLAGAKPQAPRWMQQRGLEWAFRLMSEPRRLWRRYLVYNTRFIWQVARTYGMGIFFK